MSRINLIGKQARDGRIAVGNAQCKLRNHNVTVRPQEVPGTPFAIAGFSINHHHGRGCIWRAISVHRSASAPHHFCDRRADVRRRAVPVRANPVKYRVLLTHFLRVPPMRLIAVSAIGDTIRTQVQFPSPGKAYCLASHVGEPIEIRPTHVGEVADRRSFRPSRSFPSGTPSAVGAFWEQIGNSIGNVSAMRPQCEITKAATCEPWNCRL